MGGLITDRHLDEAETAFPSIQRFYETLSNKAPTFLDLLWAFGGRRDLRGRRRRLGRQRRLGLCDRDPGSDRADVHAAGGEDERDREGPHSVRPRLAPSHGTPCSPAALIT